MPTAGCRFSCDIARALSRYARLDRLAANDVQALERVGVAMRPIAPTVINAENRPDAEAAIVNRPVASQRRRAALDVEPVVARPLCDVALQEAVAVLLDDDEPVHAAVADPVLADDVMR